VEDLKERLSSVHISEEQSEYQEESEEQDIQDTESEANETGSEEELDKLSDTERGKREVYCNKQVGKVVTVLNCMLKGSWREEESGGIRKKLKSEYTAYLESKYRRNDGNSI